MHVTFRKPGVAQGIVIELEDVHDFDRWTTLFNLMTSGLMTRLMDHDYDGSAEVTIRAYHCGSIFYTVPGRVWEESGKQIADELEQLAFKSSFPALVA